MLFTSYMYLSQDILAEWYCSPVVWLIWMMRTWVLVTSSCRYHSWKPMLTIWRHGWSPRWWILWWIIRWWHEWKHSLHTSFLYTLSMHLFYTSSRQILSLNLLIISSEHTLSMHPFNAPFQYTLKHPFSIQFIPWIYPHNTSSQYTLSTCFVTITITTTAFYCHQPRQRW